MTQKNPTEVQNVESDEDHHDSHDSRRAEALGIVKRHSGYSAVAGLVPLPLLDMAAVTALQIRMLAELSALYDVPFSENAVKASVTALVGGVLPVSVGFQAGFSLMKAVPGIGTLAAIAVVPGLSAAVTWAIGRVFMAHFESGGTTLDFDAGKMRDRFNQEFQRFRNRKTTEAADTPS